MTQCKRTDWLCLCGEVNTAGQDVCPHCNESRIVAKAVTDGLTRDVEAAVQTARILSSAMDHFFNAMEKPRVNTH